MLAYMQWNRTSIVQAKTEFTQTFQTIRRKLALYYADIFRTTANMDIKLI